MTMFTYAIATISVLITAAIIGCIIFFKRYPGLLMYCFFRAVLYWSGLRVHFTQVRGMRMCYGVRGKLRPGKPSIVLVHGFSASKDMWPAIVRRLPRNIHVVVMDLPGHGDSDIPDDNTDLHVETFSKLLRDLLAEVGLRGHPIHLVGTSLGGTISLLYSANFPEDVEKLTVICPAIRTPEETPFLKEVRLGEKCRLIPETATETKEMLHVCSYKKAKFPNIILEGVLELRKPKTSFYKRLFDNIRQLDSGEEGRELERRAHEVVAPTQIIWGKDDELVHVSGAEKLRSMLPHCERVDIIEQCGHTCNIDRPWKVTKLLLEFHNDHSASGHTKHS